MSTISTHVLDQTRGHPAAGVSVVLWRRRDDAWERVSEHRTDDDGRVADLAPAGAPTAPGTYRLRFDTNTYFEHTGGRGFYPWVDIVFDLADGDAHYHVPLLLSPFGYATYRGS